MAKYKCVNGDGWGGTFKKGKTYRGSFDADGVLVLLTKHDTPISIHSSIEQDFEKVKKSERQKRADRLKKAASHIIECFRSVDTERGHEYWFDIARELREISAKIEQGEL